MSIYKKKTVRMCIVHIYRQSTHVPTDIQQGIILWKLHALGHRKKICSRCERYRYFCIIQIQRRITKACFSYIYNENDCKCTEVRKKNCLWSVADRTRRFLKIFLYTSILYRYILCYVYQIVKKKKEVNETQDESRSCCKALSPRWFLFIFFFVLLLLFVHRNE